MESSPLTARFVCQAVNEAVLPSHLFQSLHEDWPLRPTPRAHTCGRRLPISITATVPGAPSGAIVQLSPQTAP